MAETPPRKWLTLTQQIFVGLVLGIFVGWFVYRHDKTWADNFKPFSQLFLRMIKMIIAPLIFSCLVSGIAGAGHGKGVGRMGFRAILYFEVVTTLALIVGLCTVNLLQPGVGVQMPPDTKAPDIQSKPLGWDGILTHMVPESVIRAMAEGDVLQIVVFSIFFAVGLSMLKEKGQPVVAFCELITDTMFKVTGLIMRYAPIGVGAAIAYTVGSRGPEVLLGLAKLVGTLYLALAIFMGTVLVPVMLLFRIPIRKFIRMVREPAVLAFTTASSEAALPSAMERLEAFGVPRRVVSFILPLGYSFNLDGSTLYLSLAAMFVAQVAGISLPIGQQITLLLTLMLTSKGVAAVPRASLVILAGTLASYHLPLEVLTLILGVDALMDMARTFVNLVGNCLASVVIAKWEGVWQEDGPPAAVSVPATE